MPKWKLIIEYQGTRYSGWQEQTNARTVQGELRKAAEEVFGERLEIVGAGRTDGGVHALHQVAHLRAREARRASNLRQQINDRLPADINVLGIKETTGNFHARHDAVERFYLYQISTRRRAFSKPYVWWIKDSLDVDAMGSAAQMLLGRHDFAGFCEKSKDPSPTVVEVTTAELCSQGDLILFRIGASHYVWKMVRRLVGVLAEVGRRHLKPEDLAQLVAGRSAPVAQWTAPPSGLFLEYVRYHGEKKPDPLGPAFILL